MERTISATQARIRFGELMEQVVENEEAVIVERDGIPRVVVVSLSAYERMKGGISTWERWETDLGRFQERLRIELGGRELPSAVDIIHQMRAERDEQLANLR